MSRSNDEIYLRALKDTQRELQDIRETGNGLLWTGIAGAVLIFGGLLLCAFAYLGADAFLSLDPIWYLAGGFIGAGPAIAMVMAGFIARQSLRTSRANALVLRASHLLLMPAETAGGRVEALASRVREETARIDELLETAHASLAELTDKLASEREQVAASVDRNKSSIGTMVTKLADERQALAELTSSVDAQAEAMSDAIPRQARMMADAARMAQQEVAKADDALDDRLKSLDQSGRKLGESLATLDEMSIKGEARVRELATLVAKIEDRLNQSAKTIDAAIRASEIATSAAGETGDALNAAVASALDGTREASSYIRMQSREAVAEAMKAMSELKHAGEQAEAATRAAGAAARSQAEETEHRIESMSEMMFRAATRATSAAEAGLERARLRIERASALLNGLNDASFDIPPVDDPRESFTTPRTVTSPTPPPKSDLRPRQDERPPVQPEQTDDAEPDDTPDLPETDFPAPFAPAPRTDTTGFMQSLSRRDDDDDDQSLKTELYDDDVEDDEFEEESAEANTFKLATDRQLGLTWKDLLAGLDTPSEERDEAARYILSEIEQSGVKLTDLLSGKDVKKIAGAARRSDRNRRRTVRELTGSSVQSLMFRLQDDTSFKNSADRFLTVEEPDALRALSESEKSRSSASARLAAYLLLDSAISSI